MALLRFAVITHAVTRRCSSVSKGFGGATQTSQDHRRFTLWVFAPCRGSEDFAMAQGTG
jgi:hypothetical protein